MWEEREWYEEEVELTDNIIAKNVTVYFSVYYDYDFGIKHCEDTRVDEIEYKNIVFCNEDGEEVDLLMNRVKSGLIIKSMIQSKIIFIHIKQKSCLRAGKI